MPEPIGIGYGTLIKEPDPKVAGLGNYKLINQRLSNVTRRKDDRLVKRSALSLARLRDIQMVRPARRLINPIDTQLELAKLRLENRQEIRLERARQKSEAQKMRYLRQISGNPYLTDEEKIRLLNYNVPGLRQTELDPDTANENISGEAMKPQGVSLMGLSTGTILTFAVIALFLFMKKG